MMAMMYGELSAVSGESFGDATDTDTDKFKRNAAEPMKAAEEMAALCVFGN